MSNKAIVNYFGVTPQFASVMECVESCEGKYEDLKTFFSNYRNPIGIEVEVEGFRGIKPPYNLVFWSVTEDGSLKLSGREYISHPISGRLIDYAIKELQDAFTPIASHLVWSHRTSIHVHCNMSSLKMNHLTAFVALYGLYERVFFSMVDPVRQGNPYCYPATGIDPTDFRKVHEGTKYCALNLAPLKKFGTVEFRHLHGTADWRLIRRWVQMIVKLHAYVERFDSDKIIQQVEQDFQRGDYIGLFKQIFGASAGLFSEDIITESTDKGILWAVSILHGGFD